MCLWGFLFFHFFILFSFTYILYNFCISYYVWGVCITSLSIDLDRYRIFFSQLNSNLMCGNLKCFLFVILLKWKGLQHNWCRRIYYRIWKFVYYFFSLTIRWRKSLTFWCCFYGTFFYLTFFCVKNFTLIEIILILKIDSIILYYK